VPSIVVDCVTSEATEGGRDGGRERAREGEREAIEATDLKTEQRS